ncbi:hypothetical protein [Streptococcus suis]|uniref:hypothetical protein n=1 Tax=Streptococcus suis TaxID=1307 RepID=UPI003756889B
MAVLKYSKVLLLVLLIATGLSCIGIYWLGKEQNRLLNEQWHSLNIRIINDLGTKIDAIGGPQNPRIIGFYQQDDTTAISQRIGTASEEELKIAKPDNLFQKEWIVLYPQTRSSPFAYTEKSLILEKAIISISAFVDSLNPYYFSEQTLADLRLSEESRQALEDSVDKTIITYP